MFDFNLFGPGAPVGEHYDFNGKTYFVLLEVKGFVGAFLGVEDPECDRKVYGRPVTLILHEPTINKYNAKVAADRRREEQRRFVASVPNFPNLLPGQSFCWETCPANPASRTSDVVPEHDKFIETFCCHHRPSVDAYLTAHPEAWPPK